MDEPRPRSVSSSELALARRQRTRKLHGLQGLQGLQGVAVHGAHGAHGRPWSSQRNVFQQGLCANSSARELLEKKSQRPRQVLTSSNGFRLTQLEVLGEGWARSTGSKGTRKGWLHPLETSEASELGDAMRALFMASDTSEDGRLDLQEFVDSQELIADAIGEDFDTRTTTQHFYSMENAKFGHVSFLGFFRWQLKHLQELSDVGLGPRREQWPKRLQWMAKQVLLGQQRKQLKASLKELWRLRDSPRRHELLALRRKALSGRLVLRGVAAGAEKAEVELWVKSRTVATSSCNLRGIFDFDEAQAGGVVRAHAPGCGPAFRQVQGGEQHVVLQLSPFSLEAKVLAEVGRANARLWDVSGNSFDMPVGMVQRHGKDFTGSCHVAALESKAVDMPSHLGRSAAGDLVYLQPVAAVYVELKDEGGHPLQLKSGARIQVNSQAIVGPSPSLWQFNPQSFLWEELLQPVAVRDMELPMPLMEREDFMEVSASSRKSLSMQELLPADAAEAQLFSVLGEPMAGLKKSSFYRSKEAQALLPSLQRLAESMYEGATVMELVSGQGLEIQDVDVSALQLLALEQLSLAWAAAAGLLELRQALRACGNVAQAFLSVAEAQAKRREVARVLQLMRRHDQHKVASYQQIAETLDAFRGQEQETAEYLAKDPAIQRQAEIEHLRDAVQSQLPGACPSTAEIGAAIARQHVEASALQRSTCVAGLELSQAEAVQAARSQELEALRAAKKKADAAKLEEDLKVFENQLEQLREKLLKAQAAAEAAADPQSAAEVLASDPVQLQRSTRAWHTSPKKEVKLSFSVSPNAWSLVGAPKVGHGRQVWSLVLGCLDAPAAVVTAKGSRCADEVGSFEPDGHFSLLIPAGETFNLEVLYDDLRTLKHYGPFTAESSGNSLYLGVLGQPASSVKITLRRYVVSRRGASKAIRG